MRASLTGCAAEAIERENTTNMSDSKDAILRLMNNYCYMIDAADMDGFAKLFEHGTYHVLGDPDGIRNGPGEVLELLKHVTLYDGKTHTKHVLSNVQIDVDEANGTATALSYVTVYQAVPPDFPLQAIFVGHYHDRFERSDSGWRIRQREISPDLIGDLSFHRSDMAKN
jgi:hypothetical protein